jgi:hypothetical protein
MAAHAGPAARRLVGAGILAALGVAALVAAVLSGPGAGREPSDDPLARTADPERAAEARAREPGTSSTTVVARSAGRRTDRARAQPRPRRTRPRRTRPAFPAPSGPEPVGSAFRAPTRSPSTRAGRPPITARPPTTTTTESPDPTTSTTGATGTTTTTVEPTTTTTTTCTTTGDPTVPAEP